MTERKERLGIYGGTFSPIHMGHVRSAHAFLEAMDLDRLLIVPSAKPPHKPEIPGATAEDRMNMAHLAFRDSDAYRTGRIEISDYEMERGGRSYTVYTLEHFASKDRELFFLVGTDMFFTLPRWFRAEDIFRYADIVLMRREDDAVNTPLIAEKKAEYIKNYGARVYEIDEPPTVISSTQLRRRLFCGVEGDEMLPDAVEEYILKNNLYRNLTNDNTD